MSSFDCQTNFVYRRKFPKVQSVVSFRLVLGKPAAIFERLAHRVHRRNFPKVQSVVSFRLVLGKPAAAFERLAQVESLVATNACSRS